jgi:hypothetical protein
MDNSLKVILFFIGFVVFPIGVLGGVLLPFLLRKTRGLTGGPRARTMIRLLLQIMAAGAAVLLIFLVKMWIKGLLSDGNP